MEQIQNIIHLVSEVHQTLQQFPYRRTMEIYRFDENSEMFDKPIRIYYKNGICTDPDAKIMVEKANLNRNLIKHTGMKNSPWFKESLRKINERDLFGSWDKPQPTLPTNKEGEVIKKKRGRKAEFSPSQIKSMHNEMKSANLSLSKYLKQKNMIHKYPSIYQHMKKLDLLTPSRKRKLPLAA